MSANHAGVHVMSGGQVKVFGLSFSKYKPILSNSEGSCNTVKHWMGSPSTAVAAAVYKSGMSMQHEGSLSDPEGPVPALLAHALPQSYAGGS